METYNQAHLHAKETRQAQSEASVLGESALFTPHRRLVK